MRLSRPLFSLTALSLGLWHCSPAPLGSFTIGGTVTGLEGTGLVLQDNGGDDLAVGGATFTFATPVVTGKPFAVTVLTQPTGPAQMCTVTGGSGTVAKANVTGVTIACSTQTFTIGGTVSGLAGSGLSLKNGTDVLTVSASGAFVFPTAVASGGSFAVTVDQQPTTPWQTCTIAAGTGTVVVGNVTTVQVSCVTNTYAVGGTVSGLTGGGLVLSDGLGVSEGVNAGTGGSATFSFTSVLSGGAYAVTVETQPTQPAQTCTVSGGTGTLAGAAVTSVSIACVTDTFVVGGTVSGLTSGSVVLQDNGTDTVTVTANGAFTFPTSLTSGASYAVQVSEQPSGLMCTVTAATGTVGAGPVTSISVDCGSGAFAIGGTVIGLAGSGLVLLNNGGDAVTLNGGTTFAFPTALEPGSPYDATVSVQPTSPWQTCTVANATGTVGSGPVTSIEISCTTNDYLVGGTLTGLEGTWLLLADNGDDDLLVGANGPFTFAAPVPSGSLFNVTVKTEPADPTQTCVITGGTGDVAGGNVTISVACSTNAYTIGGTVTGLAATGLTLADNGADTVPINANGPYVFPTPVTSGGSYSVTIVDQPMTQTCSVASPSAGAVVAAAVTTADVSCACNTGLADCDQNPANGCETPLGTDQNCNGCGNQCSFPNAAAQCTNSSCQLGGCNTGFSDCDGQAANGCEVNTNNDANNCNGCGNMCVSGSNSVAACSGGICGLLCGTGYADCDGVAADGCEINTTNDTNNCNGCGNVCNLANANATCTSSACAVGQCSPGWGDCDGQAANGCEASTTADPNNCNGCGIMCPSGPDSTATCSSSTCGLACDPGFADCDGVAADGCEINTTNDANNCNVCGNACSFGPDSTAVCNSGTCGLACDPGFSDCDGNPSDGCEVQTNNDPENCNTCGNVCVFGPESTAVCNTGSCGLVCNPGFADCDGDASNGCEVDTTSDPENCNGCGNVCPSGVCIGSVCQ